MSMFSNPDAQFDTEVQERVPYLDANATRLTIDTARITRMDNAFAAWNISYALASSDTTDSESNVNQKNLDRTELEDSIRDVIENIPEGLFTTGDRFVLNHPQRDDELTPVTPKDYPPRVVHEKSVHLLSTFRVTDPNNPDTKQMPYRQRVLMEVFIGDTATTPLSALTYIDTELVTRFLKDVTFPEGSTGKYAYTRSCYVTDTGKKGPKGQFVVTLIN